MTLDDAGQLLQELQQSPLETRQGRLERVLRDFFSRQGAAIIAALAFGLALTDAWDGERWDSELSDRLLRWTTPIGMAGARRILEQYAPAGFEWSDRQLVQALVQNATRSSGAINNVTYNELAAARQAGRSAGEVFIEAQYLRAPQQAQTQATFAQNLGRDAAANPLGFKSKTWRVTSKKPRDSHARMDGETVAIDERFSNNMRWPGDQSAGLGVGEYANCQCVCDYNWTVSPAQE